MSYKYKSVMKLAFSDMYDEIRENKTKDKKETLESWTVTPEHICSKQTTRLNRQLGLSNINKQKKNI